jgi:hypothetical protein
LRKLISFFNYYGFQLQRWQLLIVATAAVTASVILTHCLATATAAVTASVILTHCLATAAATVAKTAMSTAWAIHTFRQMASLTTASVTLILYQAVVTAMESSQQTEMETELCNLVPMKLACRMHMELHEMGMDKIMAIEMVTATADRMAQQVVTVVTV